MEFGEVDSDEMLYTTDSRHALTRGTCARFGERPTSITERRRGLVQSLPHALAHPAGPIAHPLRPVQVGITLILLPHQSPSVFGVQDQFWCW